MFQIAKDEIFVEGFEEGVNLKLQSWERDREMLIFCFQDELILKVKKLEMDEENFIHESLNLEGYFLAF